MFVSLFVQFYYFNVLLNVWLLGVGFCVCFSLLVVVFLGVFCLLLLLLKSKASIGIMDVVLSRLFVGVFVLCCCFLNFYLIESDRNNVHRFIVVEIPSVNNY